MKVLVVVDMQNDFIDGALGTPEAQAIVPKVVKKIEEFDGEVLWTQDTLQRATVRKKRSSLRRARAHSGRAQNRR